MIVPPDYIYTTADAAEYLGLSQRQVQRILNSGELQGVSHNGRWSVTAMSLWRYVGMETQMTDLWLQFCLARQAENDSHENHLKTNGYKH